MSGYVKILLVALFLICRMTFGAGPLWSQTAENQELPQELRALFLNADERYSLQALSLVDSLEKLWMGGWFSPARKDTILEAVNILKRNRVQAWPYIGYYLRTVVAMGTGSQPPRLFALWHEALSWTLLNHTFARSLSFLERSAFFFEDQVLFHSGSVTWKVRNGTWHFDFSSQQPRILFKDITLVAFAHKDSTAIYNTSGELLLNSEQWTGHGGVITWQRGGFNAQEVYARFNTYNIDLNMTSFRADSVLFFHHSLFSEPLSGVLSERILADVRPGEEQFPQFESYQQFHKLDNLFPGVNYQGGFSMSGARMLGSGTLDSPARIDFMKRDTLFISVRSAAFSMRQDRIIADKSSVSIYLENDSISHQELTFRYMHPQREISLIRDERGGSRAPFYNSYHKLDMYCEALKWKMDQNTMQLMMAGGFQDAGEAMFESNDYFSKERYHRIQGMDEVHPLVRLSQFSRRVDTRSFPIADYAQFLRMEPGVVKTDLLNLSFLGFLTYDRERERVTLRDKLFHYLTSNAANSDYDVVRVRSFAPVNGILNTDNYDLHLFGVDNITLSNDKNVVIHPENNELVMQENRNMFFNGHIESGLFNFYGREFFFNYDDFKLNLMNTDSMSFSVRSFEPDSRGRYEYFRVETVLEGINGELLVDHPRNKSGRLPYARYPIFNSSNESFVFFDRQKIQQGIYGRDEIFFRIIPFTIDSLDHASTHNLAFDGVFHSGGIFPDFADYLTIQSDFSLGFNTSTPEEGFPVYGGMAWYTGPMNMSYNGLTTNGKLEYLGANIKAYNLLMFPDSLSGLAETFSLTASPQGVAFPEMESRMVMLMLKKEDKKMALTTRNDPMVMFGQMAEFRGKVVLEPGGLTGEGEISLFDANIMADHFGFGHMDFTSRESIMGLRSRTQTENAFSHFAYNASFDLEKYYAHFEPASPQAIISFPSNHLSAKNYSYTWDIRAGLLDFVSGGKDRFSNSNDLNFEQRLALDFSGYEMEFTNRSKESLKFFASGLQLNVANNQLHASGVPLIRVADAAIFPDKQQLFVQEGSAILPFVNADIIANTSDRYHHFYQAGVEILSGQRYEASGLYDYIDETKEAQTIAFRQIRVGPDNVTQAKSQIPPEYDFRLSPYFDFMGAVELKASEQLLNFEGHSRIHTPCPLVYPQWFSFHATIDPSRIFIPVQDKMRNEERELLTMGLMMAGDSAHIYPGIFMRQRHWSDVAIVSAKGFITYDHPTAEYRVSSLEKLANVRLEEDIIRINTNDCIVQGQGRVNLGSELGQFVIQSFGTVSQDLKTNIVDYDLVLGMNFHFSEPALSVIHQSIQNNASLELLSMNRPKIITFLQREMGPANASPFVAELTLANSFRRLPPPMENTLFFGDVKLRWNQATRALFSIGPMGIVQVNKNQVYRYTSGFLELRKQRGGDVLTMILNPGGTNESILGGDWFYFSYSRGVLQTLAADAGYNQGITAIKQRQRQMQLPRGEEPFVFILSSERRPFDFFDQMRRYVQ